jgi:hypothetical protein
MAHNFEVFSSRYRSSAEGNGEYHSFMLTMVSKAVVTVCQFMLHSRILLAGLGQIMLGMLRTLP